jgi:hypothetical protein
VRGTRRGAARGWRQRLGSWRLDGARWRGQASSGRGCDSARAREREAAGEPGSGRQREERAGRVQLVCGAHWRACGGVAGAQEVDEVRPRSRRTRSGAVRGLDGVGAGAERVGADRAGGATAQAASDASGLVRGAGDVGVEQGSGHSRQSSSAPSGWHERARDGARKLTVCAGVGRPEQSGPIGTSRQCRSATCRATARAGRVAVERCCARCGNVMAVSRTQLRCSTKCRYAQCWRTRGSCCWMRRQGYRMPSGGCCNDVQGSGTLGDGVRCGGCGQIRTGAARPRVKDVENR